MQLGLAGEGDRLAAVEQAEAFGSYVAEDTLALHRIVALGGAGGHVDMRGVGRQLIAAVMEQLDVAEEIEKLTLRQVDAGKGRDGEPGAALQSDVALGALEGHEVIAIRHLTSHIGGQDIGAMLLVDAGEARIDHPQITRLAKVEPRQGPPAPVESRLQAGPSDDAEAQSPR